MLKALDVFQVHMVNNYLFVDIFFRRGIKRGGEDGIGEIQGRKRAAGRGFEGDEVGGKSREVLVLLKE